MIVTSKIVNPFWDEAKDDLGRFKDSIEEYGLAWEFRDRFCRRYSWAVPDPASLAFVASHLGSRAIEIGAGTGYWAWQISQLGVDILAYDKAPPDKEPNKYFMPYDSHGKSRKQCLVRTYYPMKRRGPDVLKKHSDRSLLLCWPPRNPMALQCLQLYRGKRLVFIGDESCCGNREFFDLLDDQWYVVGRHSIAQWRGIDDRITVYERKGNEE